MAGVIINGTRAVELMCTESLRAKRTMKNRAAVREKKYHIGDYVLVAYGASFSRVKKPPLESVWYGPCQVVHAHHPWYMLKSLSGKLSRREIHSRRLVRYWKRPTHLSSGSRIGHGNCSS